MAEEMLSKMGGNSRDPASLFIGKCRSDGCDYTTTSLEYLKDSHGLSCPYRQGGSKTKSTGTSAPEKSFVCKMEDYNASFDTSNKYYAHERKIYTPWDPQPCPHANEESEGQCSKTYLFETSAVYYRHLANKHPKNWKSQKCEIAVCTSQVSFKTANTYRQHLLNAHYITDAKRYINRGTHWSKGICSVNGCNSTTMWSCEADLKKHLCGIRRYNFITIAPVFVRCEMIATPWGPPNPTTSEFFYQSRVLLTLSSRLRFDKRIGTDEEEMRLDTVRILLLTA